MWDTREASLSSQFMDDTLTHAQAATPPAADQIALDHRVLQRPWQIQGFFAARNRSASPFSHGGQAPDMTVVIVFCNNRFNIGLNPQDIIDLTNFMNANKGQTIYCRSKRRPTLLGPRIIFAPSSSAGFMPA
jgi:hypothetical protein